MKRWNRSMAGVVMGLSLAGMALAQDDGTLLIAEPGSGNLWKSAGLSGKPPRYSDKLTHRRVESCVAVGMIIESDGSTSAHRVLKLEMRPEAREDDAELRALVEQWALAAAQIQRFEPGPDNPEAQPAYTANVLVASRGAHRRGAGLEKECEIADLRSTIAQSDTTARPPAE